MHPFIYKRLTTVRDPEISNIAAAYRLPSISQFISIADNYFDYVTSGANVFFYKVYENGRLVGTTHLETQSDTLFRISWYCPIFKAKGSEQRFSRIYRTTYSGWDTRRSAYLSMRKILHRSGCSKKQDLSLFPKRTS